MTPTHGPSRQLSEQRETLVVRQQWDLSCGAAALATLLTYQHGDPVSERDIALGMMSRHEYMENPLIVTIRQGFSLLDMKRFVDALGYEGIGLGGLTFSHLLERAPLIVPINAHGYQHFVVFRGAHGNRGVACGSGIWPPDHDPRPVRRRLDESW